MPYLPGRIAAHAPPADLDAAAVELGAFLAALHTPAPSDAPTHAFRGIPLAERTPGVIAQLDQLGDLVEYDVVRAQWEAVVAVPAWSGPPGGCTEICTRPTFWSTTDGSVR